MFDLKETKTKKGKRKVIVSATTMAALQAHRHTMRTEDGNRDVLRSTVFVNGHGGFIGKNLYREIFKRLVRKSNVSPIRPYDLRHTCASMMLTNGASLRAVADRLGHEDVSMTLKHYAHCLPGEQGTLADLASRLLDSPTAVPQDVERELSTRAIEYASC